MPDYDAGFKIVAHWAGKELADLAGVHCQRWEPISGEVQATERLADRAFLGQAGAERFIVYMEAYTRWQKAAPWSVLAKSALLSERERLPTVCLVYILLPRGYRTQNGSFQLQAQGGPTQQVWFREIGFWQQEPQAWWEQIPALMSLYPLCRHHRRRREALTYPAAIITDRVADRSLRADLLTTLGLFGRLVYPEINVFDLIGKEQMKESKFYQEILEEGRLEGRLEGSLDTLRQAIGEILEVRFGVAAAAEIAPALQEVTSAAELSRLHRLAISARRLADFRRALQVTK